MRMQKTIAVAGTHGKTTTTSMIAAMLDAGGIDPTVINGGIINRYGSNARLGKSDWMVVEADESDGSFLRLDGTIAVVTNIDPEHLEHYGSFDAVKDAFVEFVENVPFYGLAVMCVDHPEVQNILQPDPRPAGRHLRLLGAGRPSRRQCRRRGRRQPVRRGRARSATATRRMIEGVQLPMPGRHNVQNALAAIAVGDRARHRRRRRSSAASSGSTGSSAASPGSARSTARSIIDDYAHHPVEIRAVLSAAREARDRAPKRPGDRGRPAAPLHPAAKR